MKGDLGFTAWGGLFRARTRGQAILELSVRAALFASITAFA
jgi:hypothetical protein